MTERENNMPVWPGWETVRLIGRGSFGAVYEIRRDVFGDTERCAMKHISIPQSENEILEMRSEGQNEESISRTFAEQAKYILTEYKLMTRLNSCPNVVVCHDVNYVEKNGGLGWHIDIRMELLTPLMQRLSEQADWPESETLRLGKDMARALCACRELAILHRDVKPQNIFIAADGRYKLGDFGIARTAEESGSATMRTGTFAYMAPEVYHGKHYGAAADLYSLGMVLYWLLNGRRGPFVSVNTPREKEAALYRRMGGEAIPAPAHGSEELKRIVLKCCAFDPEERFQSPEELLKALENAELRGDGRKEESPETKAWDAEGSSPYERGKDPEEETVGSAVPMEGRDEQGEPRRSLENSEFGIQNPERKPERREEVAQGTKEWAADPEEETVSSYYGASVTTAPEDEDATNGLLHCKAKGPTPTAQKTPAAKDTELSAPIPPRTERPKKEATAVEPEQKSKARAKSEKKKWLPILIGVAAAVLVLVLLLPKGGQKPAPTAAPVAAPTAAPTASPTPAPTPEPTPWVEGDWSWSLEDGVLTIRGTGNMADYGQTDERPWEAQKEEITRVVIEDGITGIGRYAFGDCENMCTVEIPQSVTSIGELAFCFCYNLVAIEVDSGNPNYKSVDGVLFSKDGTTLICCPAGNERIEYTIPDGVTTIGVLSFLGCERLKSVEIPPSVQTIGSQAFLDCGIQTIRIPANVREMTHAPFSHCGNLWSIEVDSGNPSYKSVDGVLYTKDGTVLICCPAANDRTAYTIPEGVTTIDHDAFSGCSSLSSIEIPESVQSIRGGAFGGCKNLRSIKIPESVTTIDQYAFSLCSSLSSIEIPEGVQSIGNDAFSGCSGLKEISFGGTKAEWEALVEDTDLGLPEGVTIHYGS